MARKRIHAGPREVSVVIASDWAPIRAFEPLVRRDPLSVYGDLLPVLRGADFRIVNCESALTTARESVWKSGSVFKGLPAHVRGLKSVPFDVACLANNHVLDYGLQGFRETLRLLRRNGIRTVGAGLTEKEACRPVILAAGTQKISLINFSEGEDLTAARGDVPGVCGWDIGRLASTVSRLKKRGGCVIAVAHCGLEYVPFPPPYVQEAFRSLVDAGADCIVGHHPHVPQGMEIYKGRPIFYSLGNFVFYQETDLYYRKVGFCINLKVSGGTVAGWKLYPYRIADSGLRRLAGPEERRLKQKLRQISKALRTPSGVRRAWRAYVDFYGMKGFREEVLRILNVMKSKPRKGAAMFRNRLTTLQHIELWRDTLTRSISAEPSYAPAEIKRLIQEWFSRIV